MNGYRKHVLISSFGDSLSKNLQSIDLVADEYTVLLSAVPCGFTEYVLEGQVGSSKLIIPN